MSDTKNEIDEETKPTEDENVDDKKSKSKIKNDSAGKKTKNATEEIEANSEEPSASDSKTSKTATKLKKAAKKTKVPKEESEDEERKVPLLDQPPIIEGTRARKCVLKPEPPEEIKPGSVAVPEGKGKPLGKIAIVDIRLKRLRIPTTKALHRFMFGRIGNVNLLESNIKKFKGFTFVEDSDEYNRKLAALKKFQMPDIKELIFTFDLDMKIKKKEECAKAILNFLLLPKESDKPQNPSPINHPKRKATKRNYFEADIKEEESKKRKKAKISKEVKKDEKSSDEKETKATAKISKTSEKNAKSTDSSAKDEEHDNSSELKKPAKKRKRNQIIEEEINDKTKSLPEKMESSKTEDNQAQDEESEADSAIEDDDQPLKKKSVDDKEKLSDEELRNFLKKVLADLNLESTTMKTVYNLISSEYPNYDFSKKKRFIKGVVKSLIQ